MRQSKLQMQKNLFHISARLPSTMKILHIPTIAVKRLCSHSQWLMGLRKKLQHAIHLSSSTAQGTRQNTNRVSSSAAMQINCWTLNKNYDIVVKEHTDNFWTGRLKTIHRITRARCNWALLLFIFYWMNESTLKLATQAVATINLKGSIHKGRA